MEFKNKTKLSFTEYDSNSNLEGSDYNVSLYFRYQDSCLIQTGFIKSAVMETSVCSGNIDKTHKRQ